jgi:DNA-binding transcriptional MerR regulator
VADEVVTIGTFAVLSGLTVNALRHYDDVGLLRPADVDPQTGYRRYRRAQLGRARAIQALRGVELPLDDLAVALDGRPDKRRAVLDGHRDRLRRREAAAADMGALTERYLQEETTMQGITDVRVVALNLGARSEAELATVQRFWETIFEAAFEDWGQGSQQLRIGTGDQFFFFNLRVRAGDEPHAGHTSAFGLLVGDVDEVHARALAAGADERYAPIDSGTGPRHSSFRDPGGNSVVLWQG